MMFLVPAFFMTALIYACVGFGGGSTYNALLVLAHTDYRILPVIALLCNLIVVTGGVWRFSRAGHVSFRRVAPWIMASIPAAWFGGFIRVDKHVFVGVLAAALLVSAVHMLWPRRAMLAPAVASGVMGGEGMHKTRASGQDLFFALPVGGALGFLAGLTGIGGGIFLAPVLHFLKWDQSKAIAGACSLFILINSLAGLGGQFAKLKNLDWLPLMQPYLWLFSTVLLGGAIGAWLGANQLKPEWVRSLTGMLILYAALRLLIDWGIKG